MKFSTRIWLPVLVRLAAANVSDRAGQERCQAGRIPVDSARGLSKQVPAEDIYVRRQLVSLEQVSVRRHFLLRHRVKLLPCRLSEKPSLAHVNGNTAAEVRQGERRLPVAAISRSEYGEERLVLVDGQELAVAKGPALRRVVPGDDLNFRHEWCRHVSVTPRSKVRAVLSIDY